MFTYTFGGSGVVMDRLRITGQPVGASLVIAENQPVNRWSGIRPLHTVATGAAPLTLPLFAPFCN